MALLTILLWSTLATLTSRITSVSPLVLVGLVLFFCGLGAVPFWRQWRAPLVTWLVTITAFLGYHLLLFSAFRHAPVLEANLINYLWPLMIILFTPVLLHNHPLHRQHLLAGLFGLIGTLLVMVDGTLLPRWDYLPGYLLALAAAVTWGFYSVLSRRLPSAPAPVIGACCLFSGLLVPGYRPPDRGPSALGSDLEQRLVADHRFGRRPYGHRLHYLVSGPARDPRRIGALAYLTPLLSTLFLVLINGESLSLRHVVAGVLIIGGALLGIRRSASTRWDIRCQADSEPPSSFHTETQLK